MDTTNIRLDKKVPNPPFVHDALRLLRAYFRARRVSFSDIPLDFGSPTPFQLAVWQACSRIPWGQTRSYKGIAAEIRKPAAVRAVGNALGNNPLPIIVPCHRVTRADGSVGGFSAGPQLKRRLIELEQP
jgi:O-6-methylguanine DNA methyltransferase